MLKHLRSSKSFLAGAVVIAALGCLMLYGYLSGLEARVARDGCLVPLPVARVPIAAGSVISEDMLQAVDFPDIYVLPTMLTDPAGAAGTVALTDIQAGDPLLSGSVSAGGRGGRASLMLEPGRRAYPLGLCGEPGAPGGAERRGPGGPGLRPAGGPGLGHPPRRARPLPARRRPGAAAVRRGWPASSPPSRPARPATSC